MKNKKKLLLAAILILTIVSIGSYAIYKSTATGTSGFKTAKWYIELNGEDITTSNTFTFDLKAADWTHNAIIDSDETELIVIAPGSYGTFGIEIDASETEVDVEYSITAVVKQNDTIVTLASINPNLSLGFYENDALKESPLTGSIAAHGTYNGEIRIVWDAVDSASANSNDININDQDFVIEVTVTTSQKPLPMPLCKRATSLHTEECKVTNSEGCGRLEGNGNTITYGKLGTEGVLSAGDAFDCDVNGDGIYDPDTERFYYVSDYYNTDYSDNQYDHSIDYNQFNSDYAVLLYYSHIKDGEPENTTLFNYNNDNRGRKGPLQAYLQLPSIQQWSNVSLINPTRRILAEKRGYGYNGDMFTYTGKSARLLTSLELAKACGISSIGDYRFDEFRNCKFALENTKYADSSRTIRATWLETAYYGSTNYNWAINANYNYYYEYETSYVSGTAIKPAIEVPKERIEY